MLSKINDCKIRYLTRYENLTEKSVTKYCCFYMKCPPPQFSAFILKSCKGKFQSTLSKCKNLKQSLKFRKKITFFLFFLFKFFNVFAEP